jgi:hypothetical protein
MTEEADFANQEIQIVYESAKRLLAASELSIMDRDIAEETGTDIHDVRGALMFLGGEYLDIEPYPDGEVRVLGVEQ